MKIALCTVGSTGDIQPFLALGKRLQAAGHDVLGISHPYHQERFESHGIPYAACGPEVSQQELNEMLDAMLKRVSPLAQLKLLMEDAFFEEGPKYFREAKAALEGVELAVCHHVEFLGQEAAAQMGIPRIGVVLAPAAIPTDHDSPPHLPSGKWINKFYWRMLSFAMRGLDRRAMNYLKQFGGPHIDIKRFHALSPDLNFIASSPTLTPTYPDLPSHFKVTGPWILPEPEYEPPADLLAFLEKYPKPVIVSFGSMGGTQGPWLSRVVLDALENTGQAAIVQGGYAGLTAENAPKNVFFVDYVPHGWLFAQGRMVIHHGGAGTTTAACRAGVPSIVVAFIADQPYFGRHLRRLGIAPKMLWYRRLTAKRLAGRIREVLGNAAMQEKAAHLRGDFLAEAGANEAVKAIESHAASLGISPSPIHQNTSTP